MTTRRTVLNVEQLGARVLPSAAAAVIVPTAAAAAATSTTTTTTTGAAWTGEGRFTMTTNKTTAAKTYSLQASADFGSSGFFAITGTVTTVGNKSGQATGKIVLSDPRGTLTLNLTGATQAANSGVPASFNYTVASGTGFFAHYAGTGSIKVNPTLFPGYDDAGHVDFTTTAPVTTVTKAPPPPVKPPPATTTITGPSWTGQGRYTIATNASTKVKTYTFQGTAAFGSSGFFAISGSIQTVGSKAGTSTGRITLSDPRGTLVLSVTSTAQSANAAIPAKFTYKVVSGTGFFAHYAGQGTFQLTTPLFIGYDDRGQFTVAVKPTSL
jgi:hypothetical protein